MDTTHSAASSTHMLPAMADTTPTPAPPRPSVTFDSLDDPTFQLAPLPRMGSIGNNLSNLGGYSVNASARTSYTRVDDPVFDDGPPSSSTPAAEAPEPQVEVAPHTPQVALTFLLVSGRRRNMTFDPTHTVGRVKELVWNTWPADWQDDRPPAPSFLRILFRGRVLQDDDILKDMFTSDSPATIVHMSIRPGALEDDMSKKTDDAPTCCCIIC